MPIRLQVAISSLQSLTALEYSRRGGDRAGVTLILGHGAGAGQTSDFIVSFASGLAARGIDTITFDFLYREQGRRIPDPNDRLEACWYAVIEGVRQRMKSGGDRLATAASQWAGGLPRKWPPPVSAISRVWFFSAIRCIRRVDPIAFAQSICLLSRRRCCSFKVRVTRLEPLTSCAQSQPLSNLRRMAATTRSRFGKEPASGEEDIYRAIQDYIALWLREMADVRRVR